MLMSSAPASTSSPEFEMIGGDHSRRLRRDDHALIGAQRADRRQLRRPLLGLDRLGGHRRRLRREGGGDEALDHHRLDDELEIGEPAGQRGEERQRDHETRPGARPRAAAARIAIKASAKTAAAAPKASGGRGDVPSARAAPPRPRASAASASASRNNSQLTNRLIGRLRFGQGSHRPFATFR